jgi:hypothetical protein
VLALALVGLAVIVVMALRHRRAHTRKADANASVVHADRLVYLWLLLAAAAISVVLALGPEASGVTMPFRVFHDLVPGFNGIRVAARLAVPGLLVMAVLAGTGFGAVTRRLRGGVAAVATVAVGGFLLLELAAPITHARLPSDHATVAVYEALKHKADGAVMELPIIDPQENEGPGWALGEAPRMVYSTIDWHPRFNGYSGDWPDGYLADLRQLNSLPAPDALAVASRLRIRYVILHLGTYAGVPHLTDEQADTIIKGLPPGARVEQRGRAWLVDHRPAPR